MERKPHGIGAPSRLQDLEEVKLLEGAGFERHIGNSGHPNLPHFLGFDGLVFWSRHFIREILRIDNFL
jgi:hypothetical protein